MIAQHGGIVQTVEYNDTIFGILDMIRGIQMNEADGFVVTKPIWYFFARSIEEREKYKQFQSTVSAAQLVATEISFPRDIFVSGMLVKRKEDYEHFHRY